MRRPEQDGKTGRFLPGNNGGPGRPRGSRNHLSEQFLADLYEEWQASGKAALDRMVDERPAEFVRVVASLVPKELNLRTNPLEEIGDEELAAMLAILRATVAGEAAEVDEGSADTRH